MIIEQWIKHYEKHANQPFQLLSNDKLLFDEEHGFTTYRVVGDMFYVGCVCGNGDYWQEVHNKLAKENGCTKIKTGTYRNPKPIMRKYGYRIVGYILEREV